MTEGTDSCMMAVKLDLCSGKPDWMIWHEARHLSPMVQAMDLVSAYQDMYGVDAVPFHLYPVNDADELIYAVQNIGPGIVILYAMDIMTQKDWSRVNGQLTQLRRKNPVVLIASTHVIGLIANHAPDLMSLVGACCYEYWDGINVMSDYDRDCILDTMRQTSGLSDSAFINSVRNGTASDDPETASRLILLDHGYLLLDRIHDMNTTDKVKLDIAARVAQNASTLEWNEAPGIMGMIAKLGDTTVTVSRLGMVVGVIGISAELAPDCDTVFGYAEKCLADKTLAAIGGPVTPSREELN